MKAGRSMEPVRQKECVGGGGRTKKGFNFEVSHDEVMVSDVERRA